MPARASMPAPTRRVARFCASMTAGASMSDDGTRFPEVDDAHLRLSRTRTWGGLETQAAYGPAEQDEAYTENLGDPGQFPFARGSYAQMYRSRMWTQRTIVGYGT